MPRGDVWLARLAPTVGAEMGKTRPVVIVSNDEVGILPLLVVVPITDWKERYPQRDWLVRLEPNLENGLAKRSAADTFQVRSVSQQRLVYQLGRISDAEMEDIAEALGIVLCINA